MKLGWAVLALSALSLAQEPPAPEQAAQDVVATAFARAGLPPPAADASLAAAARRLASAALDSQTPQLEGERVTQAISQSGGFDPTPRAVVVRGGRPEDVLSALASRTDLASERSTHVGIGWANGPDRVAMVLLLSVRQVALDPFPHQLPKAGQQRNLCGTLVSPLGRPEIFVTQPDGRVVAPASQPRGNGRFCAALSFPRPGLYTAELLGQHRGDPKVVALFQVQVGAAAVRSDPQTLTEPGSWPLAQRAILDRINSLRVRVMAGPLTLDPRLSQVAQRYSDQMAREHFFGHVAPDGSVLQDRLRAAGYGFEAAGENLGMAPGPLAAQRGIEQSPGHRRNLLQPRFTRLGLGLAHAAGDGAPVILTELLAAPLEAFTDPLGDAYRSLERQRTQWHLPPLRRSGVLEALARQRAADALSHGDPNARLPGPPLPQQVFARLPRSRSASVDVLITRDPAHLPASRGLKDAGNDLVGIGMVQGDSPRYGNNSYWLVILYVASGNIRGG